MPWSGAPHSSGTAERCDLLMPLVHAPIRADTVAVEIDDTDLDVVLVRLDPDSTIELPVRLSDKTASHLVEELARVLQHKVDLQHAMGRRPYHS
ncbi:hypothetical protein [Chelatococcus sp. XZ-Ab1]|uniref:hypothetical protein n=1 Tax=Chelatococcus sp. XZ-Ab1 TaxID=3034027 RepID=UPI0023E3752F|nr:hypothetical protein [Chelatococcus sp. XZ-Ab1]